MLFLLTLIGVVILSIGLSYCNLRKTAPIFYVVALALNVVGTWLSFVYEGTRHWALAITKQGLIGMAFLVVVMFLGALPTVGILKRLFRFRGELSILGVIFLLNHFAYYIVKLLQSTQNWPKMSPTSLSLHLLVSILSLWAWAICIPLFITSFRIIRKKMDARSWKALQRYAYFFYILVYVHIILSLINRPDVYQMHWDIIVYSALLLLYIVLRCLRHIKRGRASQFAKVAMVVLMSLTSVFFVVGLVTLEVGRADFFEKEELLAQQKIAQQKELQERQKELAQLEEEQDGEEEEYFLKDGVFTGSAQGYNGQVTVQVTIRHDHILNVEAVQNTDDAQYVQQANDVLTNIVLKNGTDSVDVVSGATVTSIAYIKATEDAIQQAQKE